MSTKKELFQQYPGIEPRILREISAALDMFNPTRDMTALDAHIYRAEEIIAEYYSDTVEESITDPFERIAQQEEEAIYSTGRNFAGRDLTRVKSIN